MAAPKAEVELKSPNGGGDGGGGGKEGENLLGPPTFKKLEDGRYRCVETGHELPDHAMDSYSKSKRCRVGLIDFALANNNPLLNMFKQDPLNRSKLICKLTGDTINKSEEHIWKHMNGRRFFNKLEKMENGMPIENEVEDSGKHENNRSKEKDNGTGKKKMVKKKKKEEIISEMRDSPDNSDLEEPEFWMPPAGERWDFDDGGDRWGSDTDSEEHHDEDDGADVETEEHQNESKELSKRTKRMSIEIGPSSFATRKKKSMKMAS